MTEDEWLTSDSPTAMADFLGERASERKYRLFFAAYLRGVWGLLPDPQSRRAVEVLEAMAEGAASPAEAEAAREPAALVWRDLEGRAFLAHLLAVPGGGHWEGQFAACQSAANALSPRPRGAVWAVCYGCAKGVEVSAGYYASWVQGVTRATEYARQAAFLREIVGNPFRPAALEPGWLTWEGGTVPRLAAAIDAERAFDRMPILGDALEEAGCGGEAVLRHCRGPGPHVRGCWVVDLLLGKV